jgi:hypothetical protein
MSLKAQIQDLESMFAALQTEKKKSFTSAQNSWLVMHSIAKAKRIHKKQNYKCSSVTY